jgi:hypothetical protein
MADRRMFSKSIVLSDEFIDMPATARCLYFALGLIADDDGFVNSPKSVMRQVGASSKDLSILADKKFVIVFQKDGVVAIKHWRIHNYIRKDTYVETKYKEDKSLLHLDENNSYTLNEKCPKLAEKQSRPRDVDGTLTQDRIGKVSKGKNKTYVRVSECFEDFWKSYPKKMAKPKAQKAFEKECVSDGAFLNIMTGLDHWNAYWDTLPDKQFIPYPASWINGQRWNDDVPTSRHASASKIKIPMPAYMQQQKDQGMTESHPVTAEQVKAIKDAQRKMKEKMTK